MSTYDTLDPSPAPGSDEEEVVRDLIRIVFEQIWWVLGIAGTVILLSVIYAKTAVHIYSADAMIQVETPTSSTSSAAALSALTTVGGSAPRTDAEIEIIRSRTVVEPVVEQFKLNFWTAENRVPYISAVSRLFAHRGKPLAAWFGMQSYAWGGEIFTVDSITVPKSLDGVKLTLIAGNNGTYQLLDGNRQPVLSGVAGEPATGGGVTLLVKQLVARPGTEFFVTRINQLDAVLGLAGGLQVSEKGHDTGIVQLSYSGVDPKLITAITNAVALSYMHHRTERAQEEASKMLSFLNSELPHLRDELKRSETALSEYQARVGTFQPTQEAQVYLSGGLQYEKEIASLRIQRSQLLQRFTPDSLEVQTIDAQIAAMGREKARFEDRFKTLPGTERQAMSLQRDAKVAEEVYVALLNRIQELSITRAGTIGNVHIVDEALVPSAPVKPKAALIISGGTMLGVIAGIGFAIVRRKFLTGVADPDMVERRFRVPVLGSISYSVEQARADRLAYERKQARLQRPQGWARLASPSMPNATTLSGFMRRVIPRLPGAGAVAAVREASVVLHGEHTPTRPLLVKMNPFDVSVEGLRGLRSALQFGLVDAPNRIVCLTSPAPSDGKSFLCANLATLLSESGRRVLLIDADLRRGRLAQYFGSSPEGGLTELLTGQIDVETAARATGVEGLHFIGAGAYPPNPSEILASSRFSHVIHRLEQEFDIVLVDTPPLLAVADAAVVANIAGSTILVMRAGIHTERDIDESLKKLRRARARIIGTVMNAMQIKRGGRYGSYDYAYAHTYTVSMPTDESKDE
ncbi:polysaccharide biosynthesis tyrosine autokinase [Paraburkholderia sartisoli]|uniref:Tyrosine-protein kinase Etk/Wzc n=1 Tax=Paraburkholderia sartisoli TaxID=83784 RepID=A0A1H4EDG0_9BURK|nr:polysaccharide biosynthesis tyrosine autokinase [Paraburkholderia sartisoli]SEA82867.1 tyrosine-protein kinase Etk/Wzc [Paraburkholderia sartisoli]